MAMQDKTGSGGRRDGPRDRRAEALRANLRRRKLQARGRAATAQAPAAEDKDHPQPGKNRDEH